MDAWGYGPLDNDGSLDCIGDLEDGEPTDIVDKLTYVMATIADSDDYVESYEAQQAVAAAVLVAARLGAEAAIPSAKDLLESHPFEVNENLRSLALHTLDRVSSPGDNEWYDLWRESDGLDEALESLRPYREALTAKR